MSDMVETEPSRRVRGVRFDPTINLGHILTAAAFLVSTIVGWVTLNARVDQQGRDIARIEAAAKADAGRIEVDLTRRIVETRQYVDSTQVRTAEDIRDMKNMLRDGFRDLDQKLERKVDKPGR